ncbi:DUF5665 domain-containing protein [Paenibacillus sp. sgz5001063]|uniref:DUF5665 domain-containing protein n=1 Tax=Paenibacillus sp. sgz5001063 TaxID=3242474 RepID=UPI0036D266F1
MEGRQEDKHRFGKTGRISIRTSGTGSNTNDIKDIPEWKRDPHDLPQEEKLNAVYRLTSGLVQQMEKARIAEYTQLLNSPWRLIWLNILSGTARGLGIALGFTFFAATIIYVLQVLGALNLPIIGDYIADIVRIVQHQLELKTF